MKQLSLFVFIIILLNACNKEEGTDYNRQIATKSEGYYTIPTNQDDIDLTFLKMGIKDTSAIQNRWCAFVGDSMVVLTGTQTKNDYSLAFSRVYVNGKMRAQFSPNCQPNSNIRLLPEKPMFIYKGTTIMPFRLDTDEFLIGFTDSTSFCYPDVFYDYIWNTDKDLMVFHTMDGQYYVQNIFGGTKVNFLPKYKDNVLLLWSFGCWWSLGGDKDFEEDGTIEFQFNRVDTENPIFSFPVHLTREAIQELEQNGGKTKQKYWNIAGQGTDHTEYEFVVEYPNGHEYRLSLHTKYLGDTEFTDVIVSYQGKTYSTFPKYSSLPCRFTTSYWNLWHENGPYGDFVEVTICKGKDGTEELCFNQGHSEMSYSLENDFDYLLGQQNCLIVGCSNLLSNVNRIAELDTQSVFRNLLIYDGTCPNCLNTKMEIAFEENITKCPLCQRWYDLNNYGTIIRGNEGVPLIRYPASYNDSLHRIVVMNH